MGEEQDVPRCGHGPARSPRPPAPHLAGGLAPRDTVVPERPSRAVDPDVDGAPALVVPVVPLEKIVGGVGLLAEPGEPAGLGCTRQRAREHERELAADQAATGELGLGAALFGEWDVSAAGVSTELGPLGLTMANENDLVGGHARSLPHAQGRLLPMARRLHPCA